MCAALAMLTRTDAVVIVIAWCGWCSIVLRGKQRLVVVGVLVGVVALTLGGHTAWRIAYYGDPLPNTYYLKLGGISLGTRLGRGIGATLHILQQGWMVPVGLAVFAFVDTKRRPHALLLALTVAAAGAYSIYVGGDAWEEFDMPNRYLAPTVPALLVLATFGLEDVARSRVRVRAFALVLLGVAAMQLVAPYSRVGLHLSPFPDESQARLRLVVALGFAVMLAWSPRGSLPLLGALVLLATTGERWVVFAHEGAAHVSIDAGRVRHGFAIRDATSPEATIAVTPAGSIPYFARRRTIDLLGKSDVHVAHMSPRTSRFHPGHVKWDYPYSIGQLQPDLIDEIFTPPQANLVEADKRALPRWGYVEIAPNLYVRRGTQYVDVVRLVRELSRP
jgi:hypothetical protein